MQGGPQELRQLGKIRAGNAHSRPPSSSSSVSTDFPITPLHLLAFALDEEIAEAPNGLTFLAATACAIYRGARGGEFFTPANLGHHHDKALRAPCVSLRQQAGCMVIELPFDKTHQDRGIALWYPELPDNDPTCPVSLVRDMLLMRDAMQRAGLRPAPATPAADFLFQTDSGMQVTLPIMRQWTLCALHHLGLFVPRGQSIGMKAWRRGFSTASQYIPPDVHKKIKLGGRWKGDSHSNYAHRGIAQQILALADDARMRMERLPLGSHYRTILNPDQEFHFHDSFDPTVASLFAPCEFTPQRLRATRLRHAAAHGPLPGFLGRPHILNLNPITGRRAKPSRSSVSPDRVGI
jgi:hypothetical protein